VADWKLREHSESMSLGAAKQITQIEVEEARPGKEIMLSSQPASIPREGVYKDGEPLWWWVALGRALAGKSTRAWSSLWPGREGWLVVL